MDGSSPVVVVMAAITRWTLGSVTSVWNMVFQEDRFSVLKKSRKTPFESSPLQPAKKEEKKKRRKSKSEMSIQKAEQKPMKTIILGSKSVIKNNKTRLGPLLKSLCRGSGGDAAGRPRLLHSIYI